MIPINKDIKEGQVLIYRKNKIVGVDPNEIINYDSKISTLEAEIKVLTQVVNDVTRNNKEFIKKLEEAFGNENI